MVAEDLPRPFPPLVGEERVQVRGRPLILNTWNNDAGSDTENEPHQLRPEGEYLIFLPLDFGDTDSEAGSDRDLHGVESGEAGYADVTWGDLDGWISQEAEAEELARHKQRVTDIKSLGWGRGETALSQEDDAIHLVHGMGDHAYDNYEFDLRSDTWRKLATDYGAESTEFCVESVLFTLANQAFYVKGIAEREDDTSLNALESTEGEDMSNWTTFAVLRRLIKGSRFGIFNDAAEYISDPRNLREFSSARTPMERHAALKSAGTDKFLMEHSLLSQFEKKLDDYTTTGRRSQSFQDLNLEGHVDWIRKVAKELRGIMSENPDLYDLGLSPEAESNS